MLFSKNVEPKKPDLVISALEIEIFISSTEVNHHLNVQTFMTITARIKRFKRSKELVVATSRIVLS